MKEPLVVLIDLDGTIQGNVIPQIKEKDVIDIINGSTKAQHKGKGPSVHYNERYLFEDFRKGLLRPHFSESLLEIKKRHPNVEFFVYTASSDEWANFLLPKIVRMCFGNKKIVNRPFLTRSDCIADGYKSLKKVHPIIKKSLQHKYPEAKITNVYLIDNNYVLKNDEANRLVHCPTYNMTILNCPMRAFSKSVLESNYHKLAEILFHKKVKSFSDFVKLYYDRSFKEYVAVEESNKKYKNDKYWLKVKGIFMAQPPLKTQQDMDNVMKKLQLLFL